MPDISYTVYIQKTVSYKSGTLKSTSRLITYACSLSYGVRIITFYAIAPIIRTRVRDKLSEIREHNDFTESIDFQIPKRDRR